MTLFNKENTQWAQGVAALMIMLMHYVMQLEGYPRALNICGSVGVACFLFISGFGLNESYKRSGLRRFWKKRLVRVVIPCWMVFAASAVLQTWFPEAQGAPIDARWAFYNFCFVKSELWFVDYILRLYLVYWAARKWFPRFTLHILLLCSLASVFANQLISEQAFSFLLGYLASAHYERLSQWSRRRVATISAAFVTYGLLFLLIKELPAVRAYKHTLPYHVLLLNIKMPLAFGLLTAPALLPFLKRGGVMQWFGRISYELYIVHYNFMCFITGYATICAFAAGSILVSRLFHGFNLFLRRLILMRSEK